MSRDQQRTLPVKNKKELDQVVENVDLENI